MNELWRHNMFVVGASVSATIIILNTVEAWAPSSRVYAELLLGIGGVILFFIGKRPPRYTGNRQ
jgi:hypothetical protein